MLFKEKSIYSLSCLQSNLVDSSSIQHKIDGLWLPEEEMLEVPRGDSNLLSFSLGLAVEAGSE